MLIRLSPYISLIKQNKKLFSIYVDVLNIFIDNKMCDEFDFQLNFTQIGDLVSRSTTREGISLTVTYLGHFTVLGHDWISCSHNQNIITHILGR